MKTPLRYPGGKSRVADYMSSLFPDFDEYREPFVGGGSLFLSVLDDKRKFWINDLYYDVYAFWKGMIDNHDDIVDRVKSIRYGYMNGEELFYHLKDEMDALRKSCDIRGLSADFFVMNRITFSGTSLSGGYSDESFRKRFTESSIKRLNDCGKFLEGKNIDITCENYSVVMEREGENVFMFLDPPYYSAEDSALYGMNGDKHKGFDHERLKYWIDVCTHKWLMTYDDCEYIRELYKDYNIKPFEFAYGMRNAGGGNNMKGKELIISNYEIDKEVALF